MKSTIGVIFILFFYVINVSGQSYVSSSASITTVDYRNNSRFNFDNKSKSIAITYRKNSEKNQISYYTGLRYYTEKTKTNCVSIYRGLNQDIASFIIDNENCEFEYYRKFQNISFQFAGGYRLISTHKLSFTIFIENNIILHETNQDVYGTTPNSPNINESRPYNDAFPSFAEMLIIPSLSYHFDKVFLEAGIHYGARDLDFRKTLMGLKLNIGIMI